MKRSLVVASMALAALRPPPLRASPRLRRVSLVRRAGRGPAASPADRVYDPDTVTTLKGSVTAVAVVPARGGRSGGTHVTLSSDGAATDVHLGPTWFLEKQGLTLVKGDAVEVTGSLVELEGQTYLVAREVRKGATLVRLRDESGTPAWAGGPRRN